MISKTIEELTLSGFINYGRFSPLLNPSTPFIGQKPVEFYRDMLQLDLGNVTKASFSICRVEKRPEIIDSLEYHNHSAEMALPLDNDVLLYVAAAGVPETLRPEDIRIFRVPRGTMVVMNKGVWHQAVFADKAEYANVLICLPERLYVNDCIVRTLKENEKIAIKR